MLLIAAVSAEAVLHSLQFEPTAALRPRQNFAVVHRVQKTDQEAQAAAFEASFS